MRQPWGRPTKYGNVPSTIRQSLHGSVEDRECDFGHLFEGFSVRLEAGHSSHPLNCDHEKPSQRGRVLFGRQLSLLLPSSKSLNKNRFYSGLVVPQKVPDFGILWVALQIGTEQKAPAFMEFARFPSQAIQKLAKALLL